VAHHTTERFLDSGKRWQSFATLANWIPPSITFIYIFSFLIGKKTNEQTRQNRKVNSSEQSVNTLTSTVHPLTYCITYLFI
jgi:cobalamin biosynthesis protein CobD/CbiB